MRDLDDSCSTCQRRVGDHTLDEWNVCFGATALDLGYEEAPAGPIPLTVQGDEIAWADHLHARSCIVGGLGPNLTVQFPAVIFTFELGNPRGEPHPVTEVAFVGNPDGLRRLGKVLRDTCNGAANAAERSA